MILTPETLILKPLDKQVHTDPDYWPTYTLRNVRIVPQGKVKSKYARPASLLNASVENPVSVVGELEGVGEEYWDRVLEPHQDDHEGVSILLAEVTNFCFGEADRICKLWAEGSAGWFEIQPSPSYQTIYVEMIEAVAAWYFLEDQYNIKATTTKKGGRRNPDVETLFEIYLKKHREYENVETVQAVFHESQPFILAQMRKQDTELEEEEHDTRLKWADTQIYQYVVGQSTDGSDDDSTGDDTPTSSSEDEKQLLEDEPSQPLATPLRPTKAVKAAKSAGLRPTGLTPKSARYKSSRPRTGLAMQLASADAERNLVGDEQRSGIIGEMKQAGARTSFLEAFLQGRTED